MSTLYANPSQTLGPLYGFALMFEGSENAVDPSDPDAVRISGRMIDGVGDPVDYPNGLIEVWTAEQFARGRTDPDGHFEVVLAKRPSPPLPDGTPQAPFFNITIFARGLVKQFQTRVYFSDEAEANAADPVLGRVDPERRDTLIAEKVDGGYHHDIYLQGETETVMFEF